MKPEALTQLVQEMLGVLGFSNLTISLSTGHRTVVAITSSEGEALIGPGGEHLRAINALARRLVEKKYGDESANFLIDVNGHHEQQMEAVRANARMLAQRARLFKHEVEMEPMSSYERLVVHELFADDPEIETRSEGEGKFRHVVLTYKNNTYDKQQGQ